MAMSILFLQHFFTDGVSTERFWIGPESAQVRPKVDPKAAQSLPKVDPESVQSGPKVDPKTVQTQPRVIPKSAQSRFTDGLQSVSKSPPLVGDRLVQKLHPHLQTV